MSIDLDSDHKTVLAVFGDRRRPVTFVSGCTAKEEVDNLFQAVKATYNDVLSVSEGSSTTNEYFLQQESSEWGGQLIDITGFVRDKAVVHLCCGSKANAEVRNACN